MEVVFQLIQNAAICPPSELAQILSLEWLGEIQRATAKPPKSPDEDMFIDTALLANEADYEQYYAETRKAYYDGAWNWHRHFMRMGLDCAKSEKSP
jgi:hypothetical protein